MINLLNNFGNLLSNNVYLAFLVSLIAGIVSSFSPCVLSTIPLIIGYVGGYAKKDKKTAFKYSLVFCIGLIITFTTFGALSAILGKLLTGTGKWWFIILGLIMLFVGLQMIGVIEYGNNSCKMPDKRKGLLGAFFLGILGGVLSSPCSTPVLIAILSFVAGKGNIILGIVMLLFYSIGHCTLILIAGTSIGFVEQLSSNNKTLMLGKALKIVFGVIVILLGFYLIYTGI
ncbi:Cytochrome C biogenesis protein transmembrane region [Caloramator quimbayensis]|uniref:Cytochrome C biogenesis protein transmembrane region n=1 Tax=Caloramator quimbayensis TaxID=1147123 RepID=A0A1T4WWH1_9CLOT|nr:cytochrome c biogenesis CcdA family protein [Caloramator quimbayensis]SKA81225.1 Cytochrome C biogenesis protein transmembrane region [Caloramator quimbayensis]